MCHQTHHLWCTQQRECSDRRISSLNHSQRHREPCPRRHWVIVTDLQRLTGANWVAWIKWQKTERTKRMQLTKQYTNKITQLKYSFAVEHKELDEKWEMKMLDAINEFKMQHETEARKRQCNGPIKKSQCSTQANRVKLNQFKWQELRESSESQTCRQINDIKPHVSKANQ